MQNIPKAPRLTRQEKVSRTRQAILDAAMTAVGEHGHSEASIANITRIADVALGTFYMHFESKQSLLDALLPWAGQQAHAQMDIAVADAPDHPHYEAVNFDALTDFQKDHPYYFRVLSEAEVATPKSYQQHVDRSIARYLAAVQKAFKRGELPAFEAEDLEMVATMLVSIKLMLFMRYGAGNAKTIARMRRVYLTLILSGLLGPSPPAVAAPRVPSSKKKPRAKPKA